MDAGQSQTPECAKRILRVSCTARKREQVLVTPVNRTRRERAALARQAHFGVFRAPCESNKHALVQEPKRRFQICKSSSTCTARSGDARHSKAPRVRHSQAPGTFWGVSCTTLKRQLPSCPRAETKASDLHIFRICTALKQYEQFYTSTSSHGWKHSPR